MHRQREYRVIFNPEACTSCLFECFGMHVPFRQSQARTRIEIDAQRRCNAEVMTLRYVPPHVALPPS
jgi:hypothetical protein